MGFFSRKFKDKEKKEQVSPAAANTGTGTQPGAASESPKEGIKGQAGESQPEPAAQPASESAGADAGSAGGGKPDAPAIPVGAPPTERAKKKRTIIKASDDQKESIAKKLNDYIVPLIALFVFVLIIIFVYVPFTNEMLQTREESKLLAEEIERNEKKVADLKSVETSSLVDTLNTVNLVVRDEMNVAELAEQVEDLAFEYNMHPMELTMSDAMAAYAVDPDLIDSQIEIPEHANTISGPFAFYGKFADIVKFIGALRSESPTILSLGAVTVSRYDPPATGAETVDSNLWSVELMIIGYLSPEVTDVNVSDPVNIAVDLELLAELENRASGSTVDDEYTESDFEDTGDDSGTDGADESGDSGPNSGSDDEDSE